MPYFKRKPFKIEAQQVTAENINDVYAWVNASGHATADTLTADSFIVQTGNRPVPARVGNWVLNYHDGNVRIFVSLNADFQEKFEPLGEGEEFMPYNTSTVAPQ